MSEPTKPDPAADPQPKPSAVEEAKLASRYLRGDLAEELLNGEDHFAPLSSLVLKHHGMYQQDDRDSRGARDADGRKLGKAYSLMIRTKIPAGMLTSDQLLAELDLCEELGNGTLRITNRQDLQLHSVLKRDVQTAIRRINEVKLTTLGACGDVQRNVMCCPCPVQDKPRQEIQELALRLSNHLLPRSPAYRDIWLTDLESGERQAWDAATAAPRERVPEDVDSDGADAIEPLYGRTYLPRKFKIAIALPHDNCVDVYTPDLGLLAVPENDTVVGYNFLVGGSFGMTPSNKKTFPALAKRMAYVPAGEVIAVVEAVIKVQRDFGNRSDRSLARMKYLIADWGLPRFKAKVEEYYGRPLADPHPTDVRGFEDHLGWGEQGDGRLYYGLNVENGRILDCDGLRLKTALREIARAYRPGIRLTPLQSILFTDIDPADRIDFEVILRRNGVKGLHEISQARRWSMACVGLPTCPLTITESERSLPGMIDDLEPVLARLGLAGERFTLRMTGCPNGCARPYNADVGLSGRAVDKYSIYLGGRLLGDRMAFLYQDLVPADQILPTLTPILTYFKHARTDGESFGDFCDRMGKDSLNRWATQFAQESARTGAAGG
ncbi:MAG: NADPH-dependent assimilatory sulfite reductase hemoprotein subunit [Planctomycetes bacterium]|nr:NADPH-dependent assimilatory sulfite reductase hemoprotein subunit [Planctomycetota bacterium]